ncbi:ankyrin repeat-containing protein ITN1-like [Cryptomeria japonica]|uniref:ankyrin repeat-containing protein ITN1-like n=1 Tax=Cryptomeria japonica TaxID=3369 RepID=UPI0027DAAA4C|nr:ankyrin repeat-containing protein ITN1-like [Cryptomeria japonica]
MEPGIGSGVAPASYHNDSYTVKDKDKLCAAFHFYFFGCADVIEKLLHHKPELATEVDNFDRSPLHMAALLPYLDNFLYPKLYRKIFLTGKMLIRNDGGLSCYKVDQNKQSALHVAVKEGNAALVDVILYYCRDCLEMVDNDGRIALHLAVNNAAEIFLRSGRYRLKFIICSVTSERMINCIDKKGQTALDIALEKQNDDPQLYRAIMGYLCQHGAVKKIFDEGSTSRTTPSTKTLRWNSNLISVSAVLIATVAFAAAFTLPGGTGNQAQGPPAPILINTNLFKLFVISDTLAFCFSIASAILLNFAGFRSHVEDPIITQFSLEALCIALVSLSITFGAAIHLVVASKCLWLAVLVWVMVCFLPLGIRAMALLGKLFLFTPRGHYVFFLLNGYRLAWSILFPLIWVVSVVFYYPIVRLSLSWVLKKLYGIKSLEEVRYNGVRSLAKAPRNNRRISSLELRFWRILFRYVLSLNA